MIGVVDIGMSNIDSVERAIAECGGSPMIVSAPSDLAECAGLVLPGVGSFTEGMARIRSSGFLEPLAIEVLENRIPLLGICLGMQLLASRGFEGAASGSDGLGWIEGEVRRLPSTERVPHVGWNEVHPHAEHPLSDHLFAGLEPGRDFYFVHSYRFEPRASELEVATTPYAGGFCSAVARDNIWGVQFHPEKSQRAGFQILRNFVADAC